MEPVRSPTDDSPSMPCACGSPWHRPGPHCRPQYGRNHRAAFARGLSRSRPDRHPPGGRVSCRQLSIRGVRGPEAGACGHPRREVEEQVGVKTGVGSETVACVSGVAGAGRFCWPVPTPEATRTVTRHPARRSSRRRGVGVIASLQRLTTLPTSVVSSPASRLTSDCGRSARFHRRGHTPLWSSSGRWRAGTASCHR
jgi:hypothetical protein